MPSIQELREKRENAKRDMLQIRDKVVENEKAGKTGDELYGGSEARKRWDDANKEYDDLTRQLDQMEEAKRIQERGLELERDQRGNVRPNDGSPPPKGEVTNSPEQRAHDFACNLQAWAAYRSKPHVAERHREVCERTKFNPAAQAIEFEFSDTHVYRSLQDDYQYSHPAIAQRTHQKYAREQRAISTLYGAAAAVLIPPSFVAQIEINMLAVGGVERVCEIMTTATGEDMSWPSVDDTSNEGRIVGENRAMTNANNPTPKRTTWGAFEFTSDLILVSNAFLEDGPGNFESILTQLLGERIGRTANRRFTTGTGVGEPRGFLMDATLGKQTASGTDIAVEELIDLETSIDPSLRERPDCGFMLHDNIITHFRKKKDSTGNFIWQPGLKDGVPDRLLNRPYQYNQHMDSAIASGNKTVAFGAWKEFKVRRVKSVRFIRLEERYAENNQTAFAAIIRQDGKMMNKGTVPIKYMKQV